VTIYVIMGTLLVGLVYFALTATGLVLLLSPIVGILGFLFFRLIDPEERGRTGYLRVLTATGLGSVFGAAFGTLLGISHTLAWDWAGVAVTVISASAMYSLRARSGTEPCVLCKAPVAGAGFHCPRCHDWVCARPTCWNAKHSRCARCHEREIVIFPIHEKWWDYQLGRKVMKGECTSCYKEANETDLRECGQCHWPMCRRCWDYHNGTCTRCHWTIADIPPALAPFIRPAKKPRRTGRARENRPAAIRPREAPQGAARQPPSGDDDTTIALQQRPPAPKRR
jgi:hypothetical protein